MLQPVFDYDPSKTPVESGFVQAQTSAIIVGGAPPSLFSTTPLVPLVNP
jgi:hypothetical protein